MKTWQLLYKIIIPIFIISSFLITGIVYAAWEYKYPIIITDTSNTTRTYLGVMLGFGGQNLVNAGKIDSDGLDTNMQIATSSIKYMMSTTNCTAVIPNLPSGGKATADLYTGYSPDQSGFSIIPGQGGYFYTIDVPAIEPSGNFSIRFSNAYLKTAASANKSLFLHWDTTNGGIECFVSPTVSQNITTRIYYALAATNTTFRPSAAGDSNNLTPSAGFNWSCSGDNNDGTDVHTAAGLAAYSQDLYNMPNHTTEGGVINSVTAYIRIARGGGLGDIYGKCALKTHAVTYYGSIHTTNNVAYITYNDVYATNPNTGSAWTWDEIDDLQYGVALATDGVPAAYSADVWIIINYTPWLYVDVSAIGIADGEHDIEAGLDSPFLGIAADAILTLPVTQNLTLNAPLWQPECSTATFTSIDSNAYTCVLAGTPIWTSEGYDFEAGDASDTIDPGFEPGALTQCTVEAWVKYETAALDEAIWSTTATDDDRAISVRSNGLGIETGGLVGIQEQWHPWTFGNIPAGAWHHIVLSWDGANLRGYYDSSLDGSPTVATGTINAAGQNSQIGSKSGTTWWMDGLIGEVRFYNIALTSAQIAQNYNATKTRYGVSGNIYVYSTLVTVPDSTANWQFMYNAVNDFMPYCDNVTMTVGGVLQAWYEPNTMIIGTTLPDRQGADNDGTFVWGSNYNLTITYGEMDSYASTEASSNATGGFEMPEAAMPSTWFSAGENITGLPFYTYFNSMATSAGIPVLTLYRLIVIGLAFLAFFATIVFTRSAFMAVIAMVIVFFIGSSQTVIPMWIPFVILIVDFGIMYLYRQVSY